MLQYKNYNYVSQVRLGYIRYLVALEELTPQLIKILSILIKLSVLVLFTYKHGNHKVAIVSLYFLPNKTYVQTYQTILKNS